MPSKWIVDGRREFFGSLFFHTKKRLYYGFDPNSTRILLSLQKAPSLAKFLKQNKANRDEIKNFISFLQNDGFLNQSLRFNGQLRNNKPPKEYLSAPLRVHLAITSLCPLSCKHCFARFENKKHLPELTLKELKNLVNQMVEIGTRELLIGGGEPFMRKDLIEFLKFALNKKISVKLFSNGLLLDDEIIKKVKNLDLTYLSISLDGINEETYGFIRGENRVEYLRHLLKKLVSQCKFPICIQFTAMRQNYREIDDIFKFSQKMGVRLRIRPVNPSGSNPGIEKLLISYQEYLKLVKHLEELARKYNAKSENLNIKQGNIRFKYSKRTIKFSDEIPAYLGFGCPGGNLHCFVDPFGQVYPCGFIRKSFPSHAQDNIKKRHLSEIWHHGKSFVKKRNLTGNSDCKKCVYYLTCRGGCRARALLVHNDINAPDGWCKRELPQSLIISLEDLLNKDQCVV